MVLVIILQATVVEQSVMSILMCPWVESLTVQVPIRGS